MMQQSQSMQFPHMMQYPQMPNQQSMFPPQMMQQSQSMQFPHMMQYPQMPNQQSMFPPQMMQGFGGMLPPQANQMPELQNPFMATSANPQQQSMPQAHQHQDPNFAQASMHHSNFMPQMAPNPQMQQM